MKHKKPFQTDNKTNPFLDTATYVWCCGVRFDCPTTMEAVTV